ncbi:MAG: hypothetical protein ACAH80_15015 [Alphaproteobacteria bacterium]
MDEKRKFEIDFKDTRTIVILALALPVALIAGWALAAYVIFPYMAASLTVMALIGICFVFRLHRYI